MLRGGVRALKICQEKYTVLQKSSGHATVLPTDVSCQYANPLQAIVWKKSSCSFGFITRKYVYIIICYYYYCCVCV